MGLESVAGRIAHARRELGLHLHEDVTQPELAKMLGVSPVTVYRWEKGERKPDEAAYAKMEDVFAPIGRDRVWLRYGVVRAEPAPPPTEAARAEVAAFVAQHEARTTPPAAPAASEQPKRRKRGNGG